MKTELTAAISQLSAERNLPKEIVMAALESALISAYKKDMSAQEQDIWVKIESDASKIKFYVQKVVVESVTNPDSEIALDEALNFQATAQVDEIISIECTPKNIGRIAASTARQVVLQRLREAEHHAIFEEFTTKEGEVVTGVVQFIEPNLIYIKLNKTEAVLPLSEQIQNERYYKGQRLKLYLLEINQGARGPQIIVSRTHPNLIRRLFEMEIPEIHSGIVELKAIAREAGFRTKVAVSTTQKNIEPVGCCLGPRGIRLQSIIKELNREKIDVIQWDADSSIFIINALSPAQVASITIDQAETVAIVVVPDKQLSLAIGKEGQNARLAAKLTGWRIDIKSVSAAEAEKPIPEKIKPVEPEIVIEPIPDEVVEAEPVEAKAVILETTEIEQVEDIEEPEESELLIAATAPVTEPEGKGQIRFAEDIMPKVPKAAKPGKEKAKTKAAKPGKEKAKTKAKVTKRKKGGDYFSETQFEE